MDPIKIVIPFYSPLSSNKPPLFGSLVKRLAPNQAEVIAITFGKGSKDFLKVDDLEGRISASYDLVGFLRRYSGDPTPARLRDLEERLGMPNLAPYFTASELIFTEHLDLDERGKVRLIMAFLDFWDRVFAKEQPDYFLDEGIGSLMLTVVGPARRHSVGLMNMLSSRIPGRFVILDNITDRWTWMERRLSETATAGLSPAEDRASQAFLKAFKARELTPPYMARNLANHPSRMRLQGLMRFWQDFRSFHRDREQHNPFTIPPHRFLKRKVKVVVKRLMSKLSDHWDPVRKERFILFPMHFQPEASTLVRAPFFVDQVVVIENILRCLPAGTLLYAKEHPTNIALRPRDYYSRLRELPFLRLIDPWADIHDLIRRSAGVVSITNTTGWEAFLLGRPVAVLGDVFYQSLPGVYKADSFPDLARILAQDFTSFQQDPAAIRRGIDAVHHGTHPAEIVMPHPYTYSDRNVADVAAAILAEDRARTTG